MITSTVCPSWNESVLADTSFYIALLGAGDVRHLRAVELCQRFIGQVVTTEYVLVELASMLSKGPDRLAFVALVEQLRSDPAIVILPARDELFEAGFKLFAARQDKERSLVDCTSMIVMEERGLSEALTTDRHFEQAGFKALLL